MPSTSVTYDRAVDYYDETRGFPPGEAPHAAALISEAGKLTPDSRVIEVGVGTGRIALPLAPYVKRICGLDLSMPMMQRLRAKQRDERVFTVQADVTRLPLAVDSFDAAVAAQVFHLIPNWQDALCELARVLRSGAPLLYCWNVRSSDLGILWEAWHEAVSVKKYPRVGVSWKAQETFLVDQGWQRTGGKHAHHYTYQHTLQMFIDHLERRVSSRTWEMSDEDHALGMEAVRAAVDAHFDGPEQPVEVQDAFHVEVYLSPQS